MRNQPLLQPAGRTIIQKLRCASAVDYRIAASVAHRYESHGQPLWSSLSRLLGLSQLCAGEGKAGETFPTSMIALRSSVQVSRGLAKT